MACRLFLARSQLLPMTKYLFSTLTLLSTIGLISLPLLAVAAPDPTQVQPAQQNTAPPTIASLDATLQQNPQDVNAYLQRGILHARLQQNLPAIADYTQVIRLDPNHALAYNNRAAAKLNMRDYRGAVLDYNEVLRILPEQAITYNNRAYARHQSGDCKGAISDLRIAVELFRIMGDRTNYQRSLANLKQFQRAKR
jgi:tetratricopeptide (TPR) repeat protein